MKAEQEAKTNAQLLTLIGDLPNPDVNPEENVLFVCRLNPVTTSEDLEIIFSRFGDIASCEVIGDKRTGASLQYAFIEFERQEDCENAFFKMDKVVIDDRRIHVDFSQSVAREWQRHRRQQQRQQQNEDRRRPLEPHTAAVKHKQHSPVSSSSRRYSREHHAVTSRREPDNRHRNDHRSSHSRGNGAVREGDHRSGRDQKRRSRSPSSPLRLPKQRGVDKHRALPGADLDLVVSDSDAATDSSLSDHRPKKHRKHRSRRHSSGERVVLCS